MSSGLSAESARDEAASAEDDTSSCCIGCFKLMPLPPESPPESSESPSNTVNDNDNDTAEPELLCASCIHRLAGKSSKSSAVQSSGGGCAVLSPLPKLSLLVRAEAKCQDQLQQLRSQQEILLQQRESLEATKRAKGEAVAAERELARQRRKHFLMIQERRKREEELKFQMLQCEEATSRSELDGNTEKPKKQKPKPPKAVMLQRRKSERTAEMDPSDASLPQVAAEAPLSTSNDSANTTEAHIMSLSERRRQMMVCYSQDLSPLIDGRKPRRLPFPKPVAAIVPSAMTRRRHTPDNNGLTTVSSNHRDKNLQNTRKQSNRHAPKITKLHPLDEQKKYIKSRPQQHHASNQFEDFNDRGDSEARHRPRRLSDHSVALTAEIKPVSWAYELAKDVLPQDDSIGESGSLTSAPLHHPAERDQVDTSPQFTLFPLQHQLPNPTFPVSTPEPLPVATTKVPRWEYSAERLSSLLEKYKVSVSAVATSTSFGQ